MEHYIDLKNKTEYEKINQVAEILKQGGIVVFPTETVYGIGADCFNSEAVERIYEIKNRPREKAISVLISNLEMVNDLAIDISKEERKIMEKFFPGPLTIILKKSNKVSNIVTAGKDTVGVRMPENEIALKLIELVGKPLATPSANLSGEPSGIELNQIMKSFGEKVDYYIDGGKSKLAMPSTIVKVENGKIHILREGVITKEDIEKVLEEVD